MVNVATEKELLGRGQDRGNGVKLGFVSSENGPRLTWILPPPYEYLLLGTWGDYQRMLHPQCYRKDGQLKAWVIRRLTKQEHHWRPENDKERRLLEAIHRERAKKRANAGSE